MKALTIKQPMAQMIADGHKKFECRSWKPKNDYGELAIHAGLPSKNFFDLVEFAADNHEDYEYLTKHVFAHGKILAIVEIVSVERIVLGSIIHPKQAILSEFFLGWYAWNIKLIEKFDVPIKARGKQGLWNWSNGGD